MDFAVRRPRWALWCLLALGMIAAPVNAFMVLLWAWAVTWQGSETAAQNTMATIALCAIGLAMIGSVVAMWRGWTVTVVVLSVFQIVSAGLTLLTLVTPP